MKRICKFCHKEYEIPKEWSRLAMLGFIPFNENCPKCMIERFDWDRCIALGIVLESGNPIGCIKHDISEETYPTQEDINTEAHRVIAFMNDNEDKDPMMILFNDKYVYTEELNIGQEEKFVIPANLASYVSERSKQIQQLTV